MWNLKLICCLAIPFLFISCKKDLLRWHKAERLETHTTEDRFNKIYFTSDSTGYVIGGSRFDRSIILMTRDGGASWTYNTYPEAGKALYGIAQAPGGRLYATGFDGKVLYTDNGSSWKFKQSSYLPFKDIAFTNDERALMIGGISFREGYRILMDTNFYSVTYDSLGYELNDIEMVNSRYGYIAGYGIVMKTNDSAKTWEVKDIEDDNFTSVYALNEHEAWVCGYKGSIFHTSNGGKSWERQRDGNSLTKTSYHLLDIRFIDPTHGFAVGEHGAVIYTDDGGHHWMEFERFTSQHLRNIEALPNGSLLVCGDGGSLYRLQPAYFH